MRGGQRGGGKAATLDEAAGIIDVPRPKPTAHFNPQIVPAGERIARPAPPAESWWIGKSREEFKAAAKHELPRLQGSRRG